METKLEQIAVKAVNQLPKSVGAGNPHATFCGNWGRATASGDPVTPDEDELGSQASVDTRTNWVRFAKRPIQFQIVSGEVASQSDSANCPVSAGFVAVQIDEVAEDAACRLRRTMQAPAPAWLPRDRPPLAGAARWAERACPPSAPNVHLPTGSRPAERESVWAFEASKRGAPRDSPSRLMVLWLTLQDRPALWILGKVLHCHQATLGGFLGRGLISTQPNAD